MSETTWMLLFTSMVWNVVLFIAWRDEIKKVSKLRWEGCAPDPIYVAMNQDKESK